ncbi:MAG: CoA pyrophosphatase [Sorangiineae bacterium PRO1]|nr:CoA pyrophosphatase [Sorangiineae bacterium PRO1]
MRAPLSRELLARALAGPGVFPAPEPWSGDFAAASVVVPVRLGESPSVVVVVRAATLSEHAGELGFPGGKPHPGEPLAEAACRELEEELAVSAENVELLGSLTPIPVVTGKYLITPFVGVIAPRASPRLASPELVELIDVPIEPFFSGERPIFGFFTHFRGDPFLLPHFRFGERVLFGASAVILFELFARLAREIGVSLPELQIEKDRPWGTRYPP